MLERRPDVVRAEPNRTYELFETTPDDTHWSLLWGLPAIKAPLAWDTTTGSDAVTVAIVDSGVDYNHRTWPATYGRIRPGPQRPGQRRQRPARRRARIGSTPATRRPSMSWITAPTVAGTIGARGNNTAGVAGVNWRVKLLPLRVGHQALSGYPAIVPTPSQLRLREGRQGRQRQPGSGYSRRSTRRSPACPNTLFVFAAEGYVAQQRRRSDASVQRPSPNVICVAASQLGDTLAAFSNYGVASVDLAAPGAGILSTIPGGLFDSFDGTSMASPHVAGAAALVLAQRPQLSAVELQGAVLLSVDLVPSLTGLVTTGGRLNVARALGQEVQPPSRADDLGRATPTGSGRAGRPLP